MPNSPASSPSGGLREYLLVIYRAWPGPGTSALGTQPSAASRPGLC